MKKIYGFFLFSLLFLSQGVQLHAQDRIISGKVTDKVTGEELIGVTVLVKGTGRGTVTDIEGNYNISAATTDVLIFSFIGYRSQETPASTTSINIALAEDVTNLEEVVISGLASTVKRTNLANAIGTVSSEELTGRTTQPTLDGALYGKVPGVNIVASSGAPGGGIGIRLRGVSSIKGNNQPLFIVDGVYISNAEIPSGLRFASGANRGNEENSANRIADLDPDDIESIEVLKGASAAAIYGTRANAGVIIITTKTGKSGKTKVKISQNFGFNRIQRTIGQRNWTEETVRAAFGEDEVALFNAAVNNGGLIDYEDEIFGETGFITDTKVSLSGGSEKTSFYLGISNRDEDGIVLNTGFERRSIRLNLKHKLTDKITISSNSNYVRTNTNRGFSGNENEGGLSLGYNLAYTRPWQDLRPNEFGIYPDNTAAGANGNLFLVRDQAINDDVVNRFIQGVKLDYSIFRNDNTQLKFAFNGGVDFFVDESFVYVPEFHQAQRGQQNGFIGVGKNTFNNVNYQSFLVFDKFLGANNSISLTTQGGISYLNFRRDLVFNQATQLIPGQTNLSQSGTQSINQRQENEEEFGLILQQEFNYDDKIIATAGIRADKSSLNGDPNKYFSFLKGSIATNLTNFDFWTISSINQLKLRVAYGETGSSATFGSLFSVFSANNIGGQAGIVVNPQQGTANLFPETSQELEAGFDISLLENKVSLEATFYTRSVKDLLFDRSLPTSSGFSTTVLNDADLRNRGIELGLTLVPIENSQIQWTSTTNFWFNRSTITRLGVPPFPPPGNGFGLGLGTFFIEEGAPITELVQNVDGVPTGVGDAEPDFQMSFTNNIHFLKSFDFSFLLHWKKGGDILNLSALLQDDGQTNPQIDERGGAQFADSYIEPGGYLRLREVALYYTLPKTVFNGAFDAIKLGVSGRNLLTVTDYSGYDPEVSVNGSGVVSNGLDVTPFPSSKQVYFHLNFTF